MHKNAFLSRLIQLLRMIWHEISAHAIGSIIAVTLGMIFVWMLPTAQAATCCVSHTKLLPATNEWLRVVPFHVLHYAHTFFASVTATLTAMRFSKNNITKSILVGALVPPIFCTISDILVPYWGGQLAGIDMHLHLCIIKNAIPVIGLIFFGIIFGLIGSSTTGVATGIKLAASSHFIHDFVSAAASLSYLVSFGYHEWSSNLLYVFLLMLVAVVVPCMLSDFVLPIAICATWDLPVDDHNHKSGCAYSFYNNTSQQTDEGCDHGRNKT